MQRSPYGSLFRIGTSTAPWLRSAILCGSALLPASVLAPSFGCASVEPLAIADRGEEDLAGSITKGPAPDDLGAPPDAAQAPSDLGGSALTVCDLNKLRINELSTGGAGGATDEFVELYNPCSAAVSLASAKLIYRAATSASDTYTLVTFAAQTVPSHGWFLVANSGYAGTADVKPFTGGSGLAVAGGGVALESSAGGIIDSVGWGTATNIFVEGTVAPAPTSTQTLGRKSDGVDSNDNAADFELGTATPSATN
jgi:predicted extracellular nuclease